jgi:hypothetical protein
MATVTSTLTLASTAGDLTTQVLSLTAAEAITAAHTSGIARTKITQTTKGNGSNETIYTASSYSTGPVYLYVLNTSANVISLWVDGTGSHEIITLAAGNWGFIPISNAVTLKAYSSVADSVLEYMTFGTE